MAGSLYGEIFERTRKKLEDPKAIYSIGSQVEDFVALPSDVPTIDECLSGGLPKGRVIEIFGPEASGKTTVTLHFIAAAQRRGEVVCFIDAEHALDPPYAQRIGVDFSKLMFSQPDSGEQALEIVRVICEMSSEVQAERKIEARILIVVDSVPALIPSELWEIYEKEGFESSNALGAQARMLSQKIPMVVNRASKAGVTVVFINQERDKIGVTYGSPITTPGGRALKFFSSVRLRVTRTGYYDKGGQRAGIRVKMIPVKSKVFPIFNRAAEFIIGPNGIDSVAALIEVAIKKGIIKKKGAWLSFNDQKYQGVEKFSDVVQSNSHVLQELKDAVKAKGGLTRQIELKKAPAPTPTPVSAPTPTPVSAPVSTPLPTPINKPIESIQKSSESGVQTVGVTKIGG